MNVDIIIFKKGPFVCKYMSIRSHDQHAATGPM